MATRLSKACRVDKVPSGTYPSFNRWIRRYASAWLLPTCRHYNHGVPLAGALSTLRPLLSQGWRAIRQLSGDDAYERYLTHHAASHPGSTPLSPKEYFMRRQLQKWSGIKRCC